MTLRTAAVAASALLLGGCGDVVHDVGDLGRLTYRLALDYEIDGELSDQHLVTGHTQIIDVGLTKKGDKQAKEPGKIEHRISPPSGAEVLYDPGGEDDNDPPAAWVTADVGGAYTLESYYEGELFDTIHLEFRTPRSLEVHTRVRPPGADRFRKDAEESHRLDVEEGTQVAFLAIPLDKRGNRLVGQYDVEVRWTPEWAAIQTYNVLDVFEKEGVFGSLAETSLVFIDPATVTVELVDEPNAMTDIVTFEVSDNGQ